MTSIYIGSTMGYSGKSLVTLGLGLRMRKDGLSVGFMKPYGRVPVVAGGKLVDGDAQFMKSTLGLADPVDKICPVVYSHDLFATTMKNGSPGLKKKAMAAYKSLRGGKDVMLVGGARGIHDGAFAGISGAQLVEGMDASVIMVDPFDGEVCIDGVLAAKEVFGPRLIGMVINKTPPGEIDYLRGLVGPYLKRKNVALLGILPADRLLSSLTVGQIAETLGGRTLCCEDILGEFVENFLIGAMEVDSALKYFRKTPNKAVITGSHRSDILLAALETSTKCLVLTGNLPPNDLIIARARDTGVPVILVKDDTMTAMARLEGALGKVRIRDDAKIKRASELMDTHFDFKALYRTAGIVGGRRRT
jgi:uncharacterized protein